MAGRGLRLWTSLSGLVFVVLAVIGSLLLFDGPADSSPAKMAAYYGKASNRTHLNIGWILTGLALFSLIWFVAAVRERVRETELAAPQAGTLLSTILLSGGTVYIAVSMAGIALTFCAHASADLHQIRRLGGSSARSSRHPTRNE